MKILNLLKIILYPLTLFLTFIYGKLQGKKSEKSKTDSMLLDDVFVARKIDADVDSLSPADVDKQLRPFEKRKRKK